MKFIFSTLVILLFTSTSHADAISKYQNRDSSARDSVKISTTEIGIAAGKLYPVLHNLNRMTYAKPETGQYFAFNLNYRLCRLNKNLDLSLGARIAFYLFRATEKMANEYPINGQVYDTRKTGANIFSIGVPLRINYRLALSKAIQLQTGIGIDPYVQTRDVYESSLPLNISGEVYSGFVIKNRLFLSVVYGYSPQNSPLGIHNYAQYRLSMLALDARYIITRKRGTNAKPMPPKRFH